MNKFRSILFVGMFCYVVVERYCQMSSIIDFSQWRLICWTCCLLILFHYAYEYRSRKEIHHEQLYRLTTNLIQTEATFHRVSRELKRARSKSRSRSRSIRARRQTDKVSSPRKILYIHSDQHTSVFSLVVQDSPQMENNPEENKENIIKQVFLSKMNLNQ